MDRGRERVMAERRERTQGSRLGDVAQTVAGG